MLGQRNSDDRLWAILCGHGAFSGPAGGGLRGDGCIAQAVALYTEPAAGCDLPAPASECSENSGASGTLDCSDAQKVEGRPGEVKWRKEIGHRINRRQRTRLPMNTSALYFCDFPPLNLGGVGLLMEYLLGNYPPDRLIILTGSRCATAGLNGGHDAGRSAGTTHELISVLRASSGE